MKNFATVLVDSIIICTFAVDLGNLLYTNTEKGALSGWKSLRYSSVFKGASYVQVRSVSRGVLRIQVRLVFRGVLHIQVRSVFRGALHIQIIES
jgi:hypothetical protein